MNDSILISSHQSRVLGFHRLTESQVRTTKRLTVLYKSKSVLEGLLSSVDNDEQTTAINIAVQNIQQEIEHLRLTLAS